MNLHLFFEGKLAREEVSSAFLATLLEQRSDIRSAFFDMLADCIGPELADSLKTKTWTVRVEVHQVDVRLDATDGSWVILLENKLQAASMRPGQLTQYYHEHISRDLAPRVVNVYLAPGAGVGESQVTGLHCSERFRERGRDFAGRLSWNTIADFLNSLSGPDAESQFISGGIGSITKVIEDAAKAKFLNVGGRELIYEVACRIRADLQNAFPTIQIGWPFPAKDRFTLASHKTNLTLWFVLVFEVESNLPHIPVDLFEGEKMRLTVHSRLKLSGAARRKPELKSRWRELVSSSPVDVPGVGPHQLEDNGWLVLERKLTATPGVVVVELTKMANALLLFVDGFR